MIRTYWLAVLLLLLIAALIIPGLNDQALWFDEGFTYRFINVDSAQEVVRQVADDRHPPLYFLSLWAWTQVAGDTEVALRVLSAFAAVIAGACLFRWSKSLFGSAAGLAAVLIFALVDKQVDFSREVRHYTWLMMWNAASAWMLVRWMKGQGSGFGYVLTVIGGMYTHTFMLMILLVHGVYALLTLGFSKKMGKLVSLWALAGLAFLPWLLVFYFQYTLLGSIHHTLPLEWDIIRLLIPEYLGRPVVMFAGLMLLAIFLMRSKAYRWTVLMPVLGVFLPLVVIFTLMSLSRNLEFMTERNLSILIPPLAVLIGVGVTRFEGFPRGALVIFLLVNGIFTSDSHQLILQGDTYVAAARQQNPPWRELIRIVADRQIGQQPVVTEVGSDTMVVDYHLGQLVGKDIQHAGTYEMVRNKETAGDPLTRLRFEFLPEVEGFWYLYWGSDTAFMEAIGSWGYARTAEYQVEHFDNPIYAYRFDSTSLLNETLATFGDQIRLHRIHRQKTDDDTLMVSLWWSATRPLPENYTVSVFLLNAAGQLVSQHDAMPQQKMTAWLPNTLYYDSHPVPLPSGDYRLAVKIYSGETILQTETGDAFFSIK